jgi:hypothetical protein
MLIRFDVLSITVLRGGMEFAKRVAWREVGRHGKRLHAPYGVADPLSGTGQQGTGSSSPWACRVGG